MIVCSPLKPAWNQCPCELNTLSYVWLFKLERNASRWIQVSRNSQIYREKSRPGINIIFRELISNGNCEFNSHGTSVNKIKSEKLELKVNALKLRYKREGLMLQVKINYLNPPWWARLQFVSLIAICFWSSFASF